MSIWVVVCGALLGLGVFTAVSELIPAGHRVGAALARLGEAGRAGAGAPSAVPGHPAGWASGWPRRRRGCRSRRPTWPCSGQDRAAWLASKVSCGVLGAGRAAAGDRGCWR